MSEISLTNLTDDQKITFEKLNKFMYNKSDDSYTKPFILNACAGTGKTSLLSLLFKEVYRMPYKFLCYTGKACNVLSRKGIPAETIHHFLYCPTSLNHYKNVMNKINSALKDYDGVVTEEMVTDEENNLVLTGNYKLTWTCDEDLCYYETVDKKGLVHKEYVPSEEYVPEGYSVNWELAKNVEKSFVGKKELFEKHWNSEKDEDIKEFLELNNVIGFESNLDEEDGGSWLFSLRTDRLKRYKALIIDEYGMLPYSMFNQLIKVCNYFKIKLIMCGDSNQLRPVSEIDRLPESFYETYDATMTEVVRQESKSPILKFATLIRLYGSKIAIKQMLKEQYDNFVIITEDKVSDDFIQQYKSLDKQIICGTNATRNKLNKRVHPNDEIVKGDKIIITEINDWNFNIDNRQYLTNGTQGIVSSIANPEYYYYPEYRPHYSDETEIDFDHPKKVNEPSKYDWEHDYRLCNYVCKVFFESTEGNTKIDNRNTLELPIAIHRGINEEGWEDYIYLPNTKSYGIKKGRQGFTYPREIKCFDEFMYNSDVIVEHFEGHNRSQNKNCPNFSKIKLDEQDVRKYYEKQYNDYYDCPDYRTIKMVLQLNDNESFEVYNIDRTKPYKQYSHIAELGYCTTVHKTQGSEYNDVLFYFEPFGDGGDVEKQIYTAVTRAKESLVLVLTKKALDYYGW